MASAKMFIVLELLILGALIAFGHGFQPIGPLVVPGIAIALFQARRYAGSRWKPLVFLWLPLTAGIFFAFAGSFTYREGPFDTLETMYMIPIALVYGLVITVSLWMCAHVESPIQHNWLKSLIFPLMWTGLNTSIYNVSPVGDFGTSGPSITFVGPDYLTVDTVWLLGSVAGGSFVLASMACMLIETLSLLSLIGSPDAADKVSRRKRVLVPRVIIVSAFAVLGGFLLSYAGRPGAFYQNSILNYAPDEVQVSCLLNGNLSFTLNHLEASYPRSKLVLWSQRSSTMASTDDSLLLVRSEKELFDNAKRLSARYDIHLAMSYDLVDPSAKKPNQRRVFALINNKSEVLFSNPMSHPLPFIDHNYQLDVPETMNYADTPFGRLGGVTGLDMHAPFVEQATYNGIDVMLNPGLSWGPVGEYQERVNRLRAIEGGFYIVRCAAEGISGIFDPFNQVTVRSVSLDDGGFVANLPLVKRRLTFAPYLGRGFGYVCIGLYFLEFIYAFYRALRACRTRSMMSTEVETPCHSIKLSDPMILLVPFSVL